MDWLPEIQNALRDRVMDMLGERYKLESIAEAALGDGAATAQDAISFFAKMVPVAQQRYPKLVPLDAVYKYIRDGR